MRERTIILNGFAKAYAMTGWRLGYVAAPSELIDVMTRLHMYSVTHASSMVQWGGLAALTGSQEPVEQMVAEFQRRRNFMVQALNAVSYTHLDVYKRQTRSISKVPGCCSFQV